MRTVTVATAAWRTRTPGASASTVAGVMSVDRRPATETGSVRTCATRATADSGPATRAVRGSTVTSAMRVPSAGVPVTSGTIGTLFSAAASRAIAILSGDSEITSTSGGAFTSSGARR